MHRNTTLFFPPPTHFFDPTGRGTTPRCVDYTDSPSTNMEPGDVNFAKLREMYLTRRLTRVEVDGTVVETTQLIRR